MEKQYKKIEFSPGSRIESAIKELSKYKERGELAYGLFNEKPLYSDVDDVDSAYKKITGKSFEEFNAEMQKRHDEYEAEKKQHQDAIPEKTKQWIERGKAILDEKHHERWARIVPVRLSDMYQGMELGACLDIIKELNAGCNLREAKAIIDAQGHSGMSFGLVRAMVEAFCDRGKEFASYVR